MNPTIKKLICEDSDFEEPQTLQDFGPIISNAKDLADYLLNRGFVPGDYINNKFNPLDICMKYSTEIKIEQKHTEYPSLKGYKIGIYKEYLGVYIAELSNNKTRICVTLYIRPPYVSRNNPGIYYTCFEKQIPNTQLQNFAHMMEKVLTYIENAQKYIDSGKGFWATLNDIRNIFKPLKDAES